MSPTWISAFAIAQAAAVHAQVAYRQLPEPTAAVFKAATGVDPGLQACVTAEAVISDCFSIPAFTNAPLLSQAECLCCLSSAYLANQYSSCASYILASASEYSSDFSLNNAVSSFCQNEGNVCGSGSPATATTPPPSTSQGSIAPGPTATDPAECNSFASILSSCAAASPNFTVAAGSVQASCVCYPTTAGENPSYTTAFDGYVQSCASWAQTAQPSEYSEMASLTTFCEQYMPKSASSPAVSFPNTTMSSSTSASPILVTSTAVVTALTSPTATPSLSLASSLFLPGYTAAALHLSLMLVLLLL